MTFRSAVQVFKEERLPHFTWAWYTLPMSTGGLSLLLSVTPNRFPGLTTIGVVLYICNIVIFLSISSIMIWRYSSCNVTFKDTLMHPLESLFIPTFFLATATIINCMCAYAVPKTGEWMVVLLRVIFWIYTATTFCQSVIQYFILFNNRQHPIQNMTTAWVLPAFPCMLVGTVASAVVKTQPRQHAFNMALAGTTCQGLGFLISCFMYSILIRRLMQFGLPEIKARPGMFITVGPPSFTCLALLGLAQDASYFLPEKFLTLKTTDVSEILLIMGTTGSVLLWSVSAWFWALTMVSILAGLIQEPQEMRFILGWWAFVFPNVGFTIATIELSKVFDSSALGWLASGMTILIFAAWLFVLTFNIEAVVKGRIMGKGLDEDREIRFDSHLEARVEDLECKVELPRHLSGFSKDYRMGEKFDEEEEERIREFHRGRGMSCASGMTTVAPTPMISRKPSDDENMPSSTLGARR
ncbi:hypothetical protein IE53DRAFT_77638 [Violaceomyces palustris]|uniref:Uncharacterized protein n=1 Tax=Violaceomyces palustris TaxID=1673888 RepID=A0ACD0NYD9_9BASI|nr:hypothetical protein IE53DRAFT_77638 [Violaceomyces palustris]